MSQEKIDILQRALEREKKARKGAEKILEKKSSELYLLTEQLKESNLKLEKAVNYKTNELQGVFENIVDAYVVMDLWGNVLKMNNAAAEMLDYNSENEEVNLMSLVHPDEEEKASKSFQKLFKEASITNFQIRIVTKDKTTKLVHINASMIYDDGIAVAAQGIVRDITDVKKLELQKEALLKELAKSNDELQEYAHIVSHDLKSPLRSINALVNWIKEDNHGKFDDTTIQNFGLIEGTLEKMEQLISDILDYSSVGVIENEKTEVSLNILVDELIEIMYVPEHIQISIPEDLPTVKGDKTKLQQLFQNLISNAVKFIDKEKGLIDITFKKNPNYYQFSIQDNGMGIDKKFHSKIFKIFHSLNKSKDSTGIGLSIVKKIVDLHEGEIWLESEPNIGSTFYFTLKK